jgi:cytochrome b6-f complex iron-sulfur subunit
MTRSGFLKWLIGIVGAISVAGIVYPVLRFLKPPAAVSGALGQVVNVGSLGSFPAGQVTLVTVNEQPAAVQNLNGKFTVYSAICTHLGCVLIVAGDAFKCPCHGSTFSPTGAVTHGPATLPLPTYHSQTQGDALLVGPIDLSGAAYPAWYKGEFS